ncbi:MAG TPA: 50S ribosomal protein L11 methyltransferase [Verrucomicrobiae bacterium]|nr:50S ribosomal protein L11 methyltransferase [Verrucomicrobiae bacterium]
MNRPWNLTVLTTKEAEEAVGELLQTLFGQLPTSYTDAETGAARVSVFLPAKPEQFRAKRAQLKAGLKHIQSCGLRLGPGRFSLKRVRQEDWAESWKRHFRRIEVGPRLLIQPSWDHKRPAKGQQAIQIDPGLSFGTGRHPTTRFCAEELVFWRDEQRAQSFLDLGTGSGILAIAAAKVGYAPVDAIDIDPDAIRIATTNALFNRVAHCIRFRREDISQLPLVSRRKYSVICANLISNLLIEHRDRILARVAPGGLLVLAGILESEFHQVRTAYEALGLRFIRSQTKGEWRSGAWALKNRGRRTRT